VKVRLILVSTLNKTLAFLLAASTLGIITGAVTAAPTTPPANLHHLMKDVVSIQAQAIWDVGNNAQDDDGNPDASKIKPADWSRLIQAGSRVKQAAQSLAQASHVTVAPPGVAIDDEEDPGALNAKGVQSLIEANPSAFRAFAAALSASMDEVLAAARSQDAVKLADVSGRLDEVCESCHKQFWYPEPNANRH
jgi:cytochrome c556